MNELLNKSFVWIRERIWKKAGQVLTAVRLWMAGVLNWLVLKKRLIYNLIWVVVGLVFMYFIPFLLHSAVIIGMKNPGKISSGDSLQNAAIAKVLEKEINSARRQLAAKTPRSFYLVINSTANEFMLYKGTELIRQDKCSTGSYVLLKNGEEQEWMFKTPKGEFRILGKTTSPVWKKPDWAFIEEGLPVPSSNHHTRYEYGVLGDYALSLGDGYLIHGTLYQRFLGLPVTHGCIRLNDQNLELVYRSLSIGSKVYIF